MNRKVTAIILAIFMLIFPCITFASSLNVDVEKAAEKLVALGLVTGYEDGSLRLERPITRAEFTTLIVRLICKEGEVKNHKGNTVFKDVKEAHWASGYINIAVEEGLVNGYPDGSFQPEKNISHAEILAVLVRLLGYDESVNKEEKWPLNYINTATKLGINKNSIIAANSQAIRGEVFVYIDNSLLVKLNREY